MQSCPNCGHQNRPGVVFCETCGTNLSGVSLSTKSLESARASVAPSSVESSVLLSVKIQGAETFAAEDTLRLEIEGSSDPVLLNPKAETVFGRRDPATGSMPDIDLTPFAGYRMGVSRRHAAIRHGDEQTLDLWDLGSSNGTFLNGQRLSAHRPYRMRDGDEIRLGQMVVRVFFDPAGGRPGPRNSEPQASESAPTDPAPPLAQRPAMPSLPAPAQQPASAVPSSSIRKDTGTLPRPPAAPRPVDSVPRGTGHLPRTGALSASRTPAQPGSPEHRAPREEDKRS
ncbi:FHA domain-containing protein [Aggregatilinea lenta]|uniref:FHA domain-containing protein n=1 Tax=Aggregatilinea lenta TaxID=913108 RepID=UPI000E5B1A2D|nr:FHA domain-containing protein [Aggregatilinea lenta]